MSERPKALREVAACAVFVVLALWLTSGLWADPATRYLAPNPQDQIQHEWFFAYDSGIWTGDFDLVTDRLNAPVGVNLMANTSMIAIGALFAPVTRTLGSPVTFVLVIAFNLAATAIAWYLFFRRVMGAGRLASAAGAAFCGFAPGMVSQSIAHPAQTTHFLIPAMLWCVVMLVRAARQDPVPRSQVIKSGALLGLLASIQVFLGEEVLFLTGLTLALAGLTYVAITRPSRRQLAASGGGLGVAMLIAACLLAYPLARQFAGPRSISGELHDPYRYSADLASYPAFSPLSIAGSDSAPRLSANTSELNSYLGWPLILLIGAIGVRLRKDRLTLVCLITLGILIALSFGPKVVVGGHRTAVPGPFALLSQLPVVEWALPTRFALAGIPLIAILIVRAMQHSSTLSMPVLVPAAVAVALLPLFPHRLPTAERPAVPRFYSEGGWRQCAERGETIVPVPLPTSRDDTPMRYPAAALAEFAIPQGYFIGPDFALTGRLGTEPRPTSALLAEVARSGTDRAVDDRMREDARRDLDFWKARCLVLTAHPHFDALRVTLERLYGPGRPVSDALVWEPT